MSATSPASASPAPPPIAAPLTAVTTGFVSCENVRCRFMVSSERRSTSAALSGVRSLNSLKSAPAQKARPAPVSTMLRTPASASAARRPSSSASLSAMLSALRFSGRFMVRTRTAPWFSINKSDISALLSIPKYRQPLNGPLEFGDQPRHPLAGRHQLVDQADALPDLDLAMIDVAIEGRHLQGAAGAQRRQLLSRCAGALRRLECVG